MEAKLIVVSGAKANEFKLKLPMIIGRSRNVDLPLGHSLVSRQHCELFEVDGVLKLRDLGSLNGTFVGETRVAEDTVLEPGAQFTVGPVTFRALYGTALTDEDLSGSNVLMSSAESPPRAGPEDMDMAIAAMDQLAANSEAEGPLSGAAADGGNNRPAAGASSELATEELQQAEGREVSAPPDNVDSDQFSWLHEDSIEGTGTIDFTPDELPPAAGPAPADKGRGKAQKTPARPAAKKPEPAKPNAKKPAASKPEAKNADAKADAKKPGAPVEPAAAPAGPAAPAEAAKSPAAQNTDDEFNFLPPARAEGKSGRDADVDNVFDFLQ